MLRNKYIVLGIVFAATIAGCGSDDQVAGNPIGVQPAPIVPPVVPPTVPPTIPPTDPYAEPQILKFNYRHPAGYSQSYFRIGWVAPLAQTARYEFQRCRTSLGITSCVPAMIVECNSVSACGVYYYYSGSWVPSYSARVTNRYTSDGLGIEYGWTYHSGTPFTLGTNDRVRMRALDPSGRYSEWVNALTCTLSAPYTCNSNL